MSESLSRGLLPNRAAAVIALILTGIVAFLSFRGALFRPGTAQFRWPFEWFFMTSKWGLLTVNLAFCGYLMWGCFLAFRAAKGRERVIVAGWWFAIAMMPIRRLVPGPTAMAIQWSEAAAMAVAFLAALDILLRHSANHREVEA